MSFDRPGLGGNKTVSDTEVNEALENDDLETSGIDLDKVEHEDGERSPGPEREPEPTPRREDVQRTPQRQDVTADENGRPVEPPD